MRFCVARDGDALDLLAPSALRAGGFLKNVR
jgi:hypothetical protein